ncbi:hypothetical protein [Methylobacterium planeticum]|uniref:Uncharacterized protein n=1 Tax=Methylobacterium planeticum TaxID=2615211 RepID=A0A6N6MP56_9HYPH|nr:hypothetical protein [Methylobacterium planeticum]KAB1073135.1 hypothetical protein F6X51_12315 [Methylobacterium planeticum]
MRLFVAATLMTTLAGMPLAAQAGGNGGDRQAAGGGFMSSYISDPYHDPRSSFSQLRGTGQILGQPMVSEGAGLRASPRMIVEPHWAVGSSAPRGR